MGHLAVRLAVRPDGSVDARRRGQADSWSHDLADLGVGEDPVGHR